MTRNALDVYVDDAGLVNPARRERLNAQGFRLHWRNWAGLLCWQNDARDIRVLETIERHPRSAATSLLVQWHHVSVSLKSHAVPTWDIMNETKVLFMGPDVEAYMIHPPASRYVNYHTGVLHWYACRDLPDGVLPDFRVEDKRGVGI